MRCSRKVRCRLRIWDDRVWILKNPKAGGSGHLSRNDGITYCIDTGNTQAIELKDICDRKKDKSERMMPVHRFHNRIRRLTEKECYRLQGFCPRLPDGSFDDTFYYKAKEVASPTQIYKTAGNAVTVNVISAIVERLK